MIYAGTWKDDDGVPFDRGAKVLQELPGGGIACVKRSGLVNHPSKTPFITAARNLRDRWWNDMESWMRDYWWNDGLVGPSRRGSLDRTPAQGFIHFAAASFAGEWTNPPSDLDYLEGWAGRNWLTSAITDVSILNQTVSFTCTYDEKIPVATHADFTTFQIRPSRIRAANPWRATRMVDHARMTSHDPLSYSATVPLAWPARSGDQVRLYFRGRNLHWYCYQDTDTYQT